jgi:protein-disulfide isomerase
MSLKERVKYLEMKEKYKGKLKPWYKKWWGVFLIFIMLLLIAFSVSSAIYIVNRIKEINAGKNLIIAEGEMNKITAAIDGRGEHYSLGPVAAPIQIMYFADYSCPFCKEAVPIIHSLADKYPETVRITFRDYPALQNGSVDMALAAHCAGEQNLFWNMHDAIYENQANITSLQSNDLNLALKSIAKGINVNLARFNECLDTRKYLYRLNDDFADAEFLGVEGTPTWFINRYKITGLYPEENLVNLIEGLLAQSYD